MSDNSKLNIHKSFERGGYTLRSLLIKIFDWVYTKSCWGLLRHIDRKFIKFIFVGFINMIFGYSMYALFVSFSFTPASSLLISYVLGVFWNFKTTGGIVFKNKDNSLIFKFILTYIFTFLVNKYCLEFLIYHIHLNKYLAEALVIPPVAVLSFIIFKTWIFTEKKC